ncbi:MAG: hypothetical protein K2N63_07075 [Lachnospiraceae bacterium]|nr:hypothetical protein [Lachnospiraceae bacterium]
MQKRDGDRIIFTETEKVRYEMRDAMEQIIKEYGIDRMKFHEVAKNRYDQVLRRLYYSFCNYKKYPVMQLAYLWTRFREDLKRTELIITNWEDWDIYIDRMDELLLERKPDTFYYLVVDGGWVYEGSLEEMKKVLKEYPASMEDFYIFPKDFLWLICHCDDGACMCRVWK